MKKKIKYTDESLGKFRVVDDFLPAPKDLVLKKQETVKVTMTLSRFSLEFFKKEAHRRHAPYQAMIRRLVDAYAERYLPR
jgi:predicted DNA binding CopG/RHH family protein